MEPKTFYIILCIYLTSVSINSLFMLELMKYEQKAKEKGYGELTPLMQYCFIWLPVVNQIVTLMAIDTYVRLAIGMSRIWVHNKLKRK
jgi:hypothetical protein